VRQVDQPTKQHDRSYELRVEHKSIRTLRILTASIVQPGRIPPSTVRMMHSGIMHSGMIRSRKRLLLVTLLVACAPEIVVSFQQRHQLLRQFSRSGTERVVDGTSSSRPDQFARCTDIVTRRYRNSRELEFEYEYRSRTTTTDPNTSGGALAVLRERGRRSLFMLSQLIFRMKKFVRYLIEKQTIYVLECEGGKYYVGSTSHRKQRYRQHMHSDRGGSAFTRLHKPLRVCAEHRRVPRKYYLGMEAQVTAEHMLQFGINNVRGAMFSETRNYTIQDLDSLTAFLGHFCDLNYAHVRSTLQESLPSAEVDSSSQFAAKRRKRKRARMRKKMKAKKGRCFNCGEIGHHSYECPAAVVLDNDEVDEEAEGEVGGDPAL